MEIRVPGVRSLSDLAEVVHTICHDGPPDRVAVCVDAALRQRGWRVTRLWEHEVEIDPTAATDKIIRELNLSLRTR